MGRMGGGMGRRVVVDGFHNSELREEMVCRQMC